MKENIKKYFAEEHKGYAKNYGEGFWRAYRREAYDALLSAGPAGEGLRVLDIGGGALISLPDLLADPRVAEYLVVDLAGGIPPGLPKTRFVLSDAVSYLNSAPRPSCDIAVLFGVLMYMDPAEAKNVLRSLSESMAPDGLLVVHDANRAAAAHLVTQNGLERPVDLPSLIEGLSLALVRAGTYNSPPVRRVAMRGDRALRALSGRSLPAAAFSVLLRLERLIGGGVDTLSILRKTAESRTPNP